MSIQPTKHLISSIAAFCAALLITHASAADFCGDLENGYGPFDFWIDKGKLPIVESNHFTPQVEQLVRGQSSYIGDDIAYTLHAFPNHPRALMAMMNLAVKEKAAKARGARYSVECYFDRAIRFRPKDPIVRMIYANFLSRNGKKNDAVKQLEFAQEGGLSNPNMEYNMGLAYFDVGDYEKSLFHAQRAYQGGFDLPGLKRKLMHVGKWREPTEPVPAAAKGVVPEQDATKAGTAK